MWIIGSNQWDGKYTTGFSGGQFILLALYDNYLRGESGLRVHADVCRKSHTARGIVTIVTADCGDPFCLFSGADHLEFRAQRH